LASNEKLPKTNQNHILVIDDDKAVLTSMVRVLEKNGFVVDTAETGKEAIGKSKTQRYDVVLVDLRLPDMDGIEVLSKANVNDTVKIMLTGYPSLVTGMQAMDKGVDAYLHKPIRPEELILLVKAKLTSKKQNR
jgi:DNA-binding response OmpR family regulator